MKHAPWSLFKSLRKKKSSKSDMRATIKKAGLNVMRYIVRMLKRITKQGPNYE